MAGFIPAFLIDKINVICYNILYNREKGGMVVKEQQKEYGTDVTTALASFPYFVLKNEIQKGYNLYTQE